MSRRPAEAGFDLGVEIDHQVSNFLAVNGVTLKAIAVGEKREQCGPNHWARDLKPKIVDRIVWAIERHDVVNELNVFAWNYHSDSPVCFVGDLISAGSPMPADTQRTVIA